MKCLVKTNGEQCDREAHSHGQCKLHFHYFVNQVRHRKMTWSFLEQAGEYKREFKSEKGTELAKVVKRSAKHA